MLERNKKILLMTFDSIASCAKRKSSGEGELFFAFSKVIGIILFFSPPSRLLAFLRRNYDWKSEHEKLEKNQITFRWIQMIFFLLVSKQIFLRASSEVTSRHDSALQRHLSNAATFAVEFMIFIYEESKYKYKQKLKSRKERRDKIPF